MKDKDTGLNVMTPDRLRLEMYFFSQDKSAEAVRGLWLVPTAPTCISETAKVP